VAELIQNIKTAWARTAPVQRVVLVGVLLLCVGAVVVLVNWARKPTFALLYSQLAPEDAAKVVERVKEQKLAYEVRNGGTAVYVPQDQVYALRLSLAGQGLPGGEQGGYRILDDEKIGASPFSQQVNYLRAIEGELAKTIQLIDGVAAARVKIVLPANSLFADQQGQASASVMLQLRSGRRLGPGAVGAIVHLLAGGVEGLTPQKVVVVDSAGNLLSGEGDDTLARKAGTFLDYKTQVEQYLSGKAEDMLAAALGPGRASVRVDATIETAALEQTVETYDPKPVVSREETVSKSTASVAPAGGTESPGNSEKESTTTSEYLTGRTTKRQTEMPGKVSGLSVAALVDLGAVPQGGTRLTIADAEQIIRGAIGLGEKDRVTVKEATFYQPPAPEPVAAEGWLTKDFTLEIIQRASLGVLVIGALLAMRMLGGKAKTAGQELAALAPAGAGAMAALAADGSLGRLLPGSAEGGDPDRLRAHISQALQENPEEVRRLFMTWAQSEKESR